MLNVKKLQAIRDKILGVTVNPAKYGDLNSVVYLQQILDAVKGTNPLNVNGNLAEHIYLQKILNAKRGVADGQFGSLPNSVYLQQLINAYNGVADRQFGSLSENTYLDAWYAMATPARNLWYLAGGIPASQCSAAYQAIGAASYAASKINLANPGINNATEGAAPAWNPTDGWVGDGTKWLRTGLAADQATWAFMFRFSDCTANGNLGLWNLGANLRFTILVRPIVNNDIDYRYKVDNSVGPVLVAGTLALGGTKGWRNGIAEPFTQSPASTSSEAFIFTDAIAGPKITAKIQALAIWNVSPTAPQMLAVHTAMMALTASTPP